MSRLLARPSSRPFPLLRAATLAGALLTTLLLPDAGRCAEEPSLGELTGAGADGLMHPLVLRRVEHQVDVAGPLASVVLEQEFVNDTDETLDVSYLFPLPPSAAVHAFRMQVGGRVLEGVVKEKGEARRTFETARREGRRTSLLEQHRPNAFTSRVANVLAGDVIVVRVSYALVVPQDLGWYRLRLPLTSAQRYSRDDSSSCTKVPGAPRAAAEFVPGRDLRISVHLDPGVPVLGIDSPTHQVVATGDARGVTVTLARDDEPADRDFVLAYALGDKRDAAATAFVSPAQDGTRHVLVLLAPPQEPKQGFARPKEVLFVLDTSGSMGDGSLLAATEALSACLAGLGPQDRFNIIEYDNLFTRFADAPVAAEPQAVERARRWTSGLLPDGGTELLPALASALAEPASEGHHRIVIVLTDGHVGNEDDVLRLLATSLADARLFLVAIGSAPNSHLAERMAEEGRGTVEYLSPGQSVSQGVQRLLARIDAPLAWDVELSFGGADADDVLPERVPDLYAGQPVAVFARVKDDGPFAIDVTAETATRLAHWRVDVDPATATQHPVVATLWAREMLRRLERDLALAGAADNRASTLDRDSLRSRIVEHALRHGLASSATSFVVEELTPVTSDEGGRSVTVPIATPAAWPRTATSRPLRLLAGLLLALLGISGLAWTALQLTEPEPGRVA